MLVKDQTGEITKCVVDYSCYENEEALMNGLEKTAKMCYFSNTSGYLSGLSSPSGIESKTKFMSAPVLNSAGQTRLPTFSKIRRLLS